MVASGAWFPANGLKCDSALTGKNRPLRELEVPTSITPPKLSRPGQRQAKLLAGLAILLVAAGWLFADTLEDVATGDPLVKADAAIFGALQNLRSPTADSVMIAVTEIGDAAVVIPIALAVFLFLAWRGAWRTAAYWLVAIAGASALNTAIKVVLHRTRPEDLFYSGWSAFSFPSGHSTVNTALYGFFAFLIAREVGFVWRLLIALAAAAWIILIAFSRIYLGAHWYSDATGGLAFGTAWLAALGLFYTRSRTDRIDPGRLLAVGCVALVLAGGINVYRRHALDLGRYAVPGGAPVMQPVGQ